MPTAPTGCDLDVNGDETAQTSMVTLDDLVGNLGPFDGSNWRFLTPGELVGAMTEAPDPRLKRRRGRPPKRPGEGRAPYRKTAMWYADQAKRRAVSGS
jgi:hypothetical protein